MYHIETICIVIVYIVTVRIIVIHAVDVHTVYVNNATLHSAIHAALCPHCRRSQVIAHLP